MNFKPLNDSLLIKKLQKSEESEGGIVLLPDMDKETVSKATVVVVGRGKVLPDGNLLPSIAKAGDVVLFTSKGKELTIEGEDYHLIKESDLLCVVS